MNNEKIARQLINLAKDLTGKNVESDQKRYAYAYDREIREINKRLEKLEKSVKDLEN